MFETTSRHEFREVACAICNVRPAMTNDILCGECSDHCEDLVKSARYRAMKLDARSEYMQTALANVEPKVKLRQVTQASRYLPGLEKRSATEFLESRQPFQIQSLQNWKLSSKHVGYVMLGIGLLALALTATFITACFKFY
jgi:hypothetical protein